MTRLFRLPAAIGLAAALCGGAAFGQYPAHPDTRPDILAADLAARDKAIADDAFRGRGPGTAEGELAAAWIAEELRHAGVGPGNHGSYFQDVPAVSITLDPGASSLAVQTGSGTVRPVVPDQAVFWTPHYDTSDVSVVASPLVFVGYGVVAPEYHWNDYAGADVRGKTVVVLVNDPGNEDANTDPAFFKGRAMTYYGRWTYKFEEAQRQGAAAVLIVHETVPAAYGWQVVRNSNSGPKLWLGDPGNNTGRPTIEGWITRATAEDLFRRAGLSYADLKQAANRPGFRAVDMTGETLTATAHSRVTYISTRNVVGLIPGREKPEEIFLYTAHWDHLGEKPGLPGADKIYNGAVDDGMGVAGVLEIAEAFAHTDKAPRRSVAFAFWTLEEQGLLGSQYFADHPIWPPRQIVGAINIDVLMPQGLTHDMTVVGNGASQLEDVLTPVLAQDHRVIAPDPHPERGSFYRSDHLSLAKIGVPVLYLHSGVDLLNGGRAAGMANYETYETKFYHQPTDEFDPAWDLSGPVADLKVAYRVGRIVADGSDWPDWYAGNEFKAARDRSRAGG
jgi:Zn-dependent M28 family amino/carboxypeptidase